MLNVSGAFERALTRQRSVSWRASVFERHGHELVIDLDISEWNLDGDEESVPMEILTMTAVDEQHRLDVSPQNAGKWLSRTIRFEWGLYVDDRFEWVDLIEGPISEAERVGAEVKFTVTSKDAQHTEPCLFRKSFSVRKHTRIDRVIRSIAEERGEDKFDLESVHRRLDRDRTWAAGQDPWLAMQNQAGNLESHQLYYRPSGHLRLRRRPQHPGWRFSEKDEETTVLGHPSNRVSIEPLRDTVIVRGEKPYKKEVTRHMKLDEKAEVGDNSIKVVESKDVEAGKKIVIGQGDKKETRTVSGSYTPGAETIPLQRGLEFNHPKGASVEMTVTLEKVRPITGRAEIGQNHPLSSQNISDGKRPRIQMVDRPGIHDPAVAKTKAERIVDGMRAGVEHEIGIESLIIPHLEIGDIVSLRTDDDGTYSFRLKNRHFSSDGRMTINRKRKVVPKKRRKRRRGPKARVKRVRREIRGMVLAEPLTTSWSDGASLLTEAVTDASATGGTIVFEPDTPNEEVGHYTTINEETDELVGVTRPNTKKVHPVGAFIQAGPDPIVEKTIDGYVDDEQIAALGIPVPPTKYAYFSVSTTEADEEVVQLEVDEVGELFVLEGPEGKPPEFDQDLEQLPAVGGGDASQGELDPDTGQVKLPPGMGFEDGQPPSSVPTPTAFGMIGNSINVRVPTIANSSLVKYHLHCLDEATRATRGEEDWEPAEDTFVATQELAGTEGFSIVFTVADFPATHVLDGTAFDPPQPDALYFFKVVPADGAGDAPGPYPEASTSSVKIETVQIDNEAITSALIAAGAITEVKVDTAAITEAKLAASAVTETKIASDAVTSPKIVAGAVLAGKIAAGAVTTDKLDALAVTADKIAANAVTAAKIIAGAIETAKLAAGAVTADKIQANAVTADKIAANAVTSDKIAANTIVAGDIAAGTITATQIAGSTITADKLSVATLSAITANLGTVTAGSITGISITGGTLTTATAGSLRILISGASADTIQWLDASNNLMARLYGDSSGQAELYGLNLVNITAPSGTGQLLLRTRGSTKMTIDTNPTFHVRPNWDAGLSAAASSGFAGYLLAQLNGTNIKIPYHSN